MTSELLLDVSELEAPEPLIKAIDAAQRLAPGTYLRFCHRMKPCHLYDHLTQRGFESDTRVGELAACEVFIWRRGDTAAAKAAKAAAATLKPWKD